MRPLRNKNKIFRRKYVRKCILELVYDVLENNFGLDEDDEEVRQVSLDLFHNVEQIISQLGVHKQNIPSIVMEFQQYQFDIEYPMHVDNVFVLMLNALHDQIHEINFLPNLKIKTKQSF